MKLTVDTKVLLKLDITPNQYVFLELLRLDKQKKLDNLAQFGTFVISDNDVLYLEDKGYLESVDGMLLTPTDKYLSKVGNQSCESWIEEWRELFPKKDGSGRLKRGDKQDCIKKMNKFLQEYDYSKEQIFEATKKYVKVTNPDYMRDANYFINKDGNSQLSLYCESLGQIEEKVSFTKFI